MRREIQKTQRLKRHHGLGFEIQHFLLLLIYFAVFIVVLPWVETLQREHSTPIAQGYAPVLIVLSPLFLYLLCSRVFKDAFPGRVVLTCTVLVAACLILFPDEPTRRGDTRPSLHICMKTLIWPLFSFSVIFLIFQWQAFKRKMLIKARLKARDEGRGFTLSPRKAEQARIDTSNLSALVVGEGKPNPDRSESVGMIQAGVSLVIVLGLNYGFVLLIQALVISDDFRAQFTISQYVLSFVLSLVYTPLLFVLVGQLNRRHNPVGLLFLGCSLSWVGMLLWMSNPACVHILGIPMACYAIGVIFGSGSPALRKRFGLNAHKIPLDKDESLEQRLDQERQQERKFHSKRENVGFFRNLYNKMK